MYAFFLQQVTEEYLYYLQNKKLNYLKSIIFHYVFEDKIVNRYK